MPMHPTTIEKIRRVDKLIKLGQTMVQACKIVGINRSWYYTAKKRLESAR